ncbi:MAG: FixH family protein [Chitinophagales bacterium]
MNFHWGYKAAVFYLSFVVFMLVLVAKAVNQDFDLVTENYYDKDLSYQQQIDRSQNSKNLQQPLKIIFDRDKAQLTFTFPEDMDDVNGEIHLYKPDKAAYDLKIPIEKNEAGVQFIDFSKQAEGLWRAKVHWSANGIDYYDENVFVKQ